MKTRSGKNYNPKRVRTGDSPFNMKTRSGKKYGKNQKRVGIAKKSSTQKGRIVKAPKSRFKMEQVLANELLIMIFRGLLNVTSFKYMNSIRTVCKKLNELIKLVLIDEIHDRFNGTIVSWTDTDSGERRHTPITLVYNSSDSTFTFLLNDTMPYNYPVVPNKKDISHQFCFKNNTVRFCVGHLYSDSNVTWNYEDCKYSYKKDIKFIECEALMFHLNKLCVVWDLIDGNLNTEEASQYKHIIKI